MNEEQGAKWLEGVGFERLGLKLWRHDLLQVSMSFGGSWWVILNEDGSAVEWAVAPDMALRAYLCPLREAIEAVFDEA